MPAPTLDLLFRDHDPATPLSGARLTQLVAAVNEAMAVPDEALAERIDDTESLTRQALDRFMVKVPKGERWANVKDYLDPERVPGVTDDRPAFEAARLTGRPVYAPADTYYLSQTPDWGDNCRFSGDGKGRTVIKFLESAPAGAILWGVTNFGGTVQGYFSDFTLDGNCQRQGGALVAAGGSQSSTFTLRNVRHFFVDRVSSINSLQHGFDVTRGSVEYAYVGDGNLATLRSSDVHFDQCDASNFGDDGFTTHSSDYVTFSRSIAFYPRLRGNCNGFEIDGDSRYCTLNDNRTYGCYAGVEVKGHGTESAAMFTTINGHRDTGSVRSFNFRHIGYQTGADPVSLTALGITASDLVSIDANNDAGFQDDATPRGLSVSAYQGVVINGLVIKGRRGYGAGAIAVQVQYRASAQINGLIISGWTGAELDVSLTTNGRVGITGLNVHDSASNCLYLGSTVASARIDVTRLTAPTAGGGTGIDAYSTNGVEFSGLDGITGYTTAVRADLTNYASAAHFRRRARDVPAGVTSMKALNPTEDYYASSSTFAAFTTDRPTGVTGGHFITHSRLSADACIQTITKNTGSSVQYWRILYWSNQTATSWMLVSAAAVAYSAT